jgi:cell division initiation protein
MTGLGFLSPEAEDVLHPQFTRVLKGFDSEEVEAYVEQMVARIDKLEKELDDMREQRDAAERRYSAVKEEAYRQAAARMSDVLAAADRTADKVRRDAEEETARLVKDAQQQAEQLRREAEGESCRLRSEGEEILRSANEEAERVLGELATRREEVLTEFSSIRSRVLGIVTNLDGAASASAAVELPEPPKAEDEAERPGGRTAPGRNGSDRGSDDLLELPQGFDLILPDLLHDEEP